MTKYYVKPPSLVHIQVALADLADLRVFANSSCFVPHSNWKIISWSVYYLFILWPTVFANICNNAMHCKIPNWKRLYNLTCMLSSRWNLWIIFFIMNIVILISNSSFFLRQSLRFLFTPNYLRICGCLRIFVNISSIADFVEWLWVLWWESLILWQLLAKKKSFGWPAPGKIILSGRISYINLS